MGQTPIAMVNGEAESIGFACAEDGFQLILVDINAERVYKAAACLGGDTHPFDCNIGSAAAIGALFDKTETETGSVAALINNAGVTLSDPL